MRLLTAALLIAAAPASAQTGGMTMLGDLHIERPMLRATPPNAPVAGGFLTVENTGATDDVLIAASIADEVAGRVELHEMTMADGVMSMSEVAGGIPVPSGETVVLAPGGLHLMLMGLEAGLAPGDTHDVTLTFAEAGVVTLTMPVLTLGEIRAAMEGAPTGHEAMTGDGDGMAGDAHDGH